MSPEPGLTVMAPSLMVHFTSLLFFLDDFHFEKSFPSNSTIASDGAVESELFTIAADGVTTRGSGFHSSDDSGVSFVVSNCALAMSDTDIASIANVPLLYILINCLMVKFGRQI